MIKPEGQNKPLIEILLGLGIDGGNRIGVITQILLEGQGFTMSMNSLGETYCIQYKWHKPNNSKKQNGLLNGSIFFIWSASPYPVSDDLIVPIPHSMSSSILNWIKPSVCAN